MAKWEWLSKLLKSPTAKLAGGTLNLAGNYWTGDTIGEHIGVIAGADNPSEWGQAGGALYTGLMPATRSLGMAFDLGYGAGEVINALTGADKHLADYLTKIDPQDQMKKSLWDKERFQDPEWIAARNRYLARKQAQQAVAQKSFEDLSFAPSSEVGSEQLQVIPVSLWDKFQTYAANGLRR